MGLSAQFTESSLEAAEITLHGFRGFLLSAILSLTYPCGERHWSGGSGFSSPLPFWTLATSPPEAHSLPAEPVHLPGSHPTQLEGLACALSRGHGALMASLEMLQGHRTGIQRNGALHRISSGITALAGLTGIGPKMHRTQKPVCCILVLLSAQFNKRPETAAAPTGLSSLQGPCELLLLSPLQRRLRKGR